MKTNAINFCIANGVIVTVFAFASTGAFGNEVLKPMSERDLSFEDPGANEGFLKSWHAKEQYLTKAEYIFDGKLAVKANEKQPNWYLKTFAEWTTKTVDAIERGRFTGKAIAQTLVVHENPNLCLLRDYKYVVGRGVWAGEVAPSDKAIRDAFGIASQMGKMVPKGTGDVLWTLVDIYNPLFGEWGRALSDISMEWAKANIGELTDDGTIAFGPKSLVGKAMGGQESSKVFNMAAQFSKEISEKKVAMNYVGGRMKAVEVQNVSLDGIKPSESPEDFRRMMMQCRQLKKNEPLDAVISRESAMPTKELFDGAARKPGDKWLVDASLLSTFLHPDLKGCFKGSAVIEYVEDQKGENGYYSDDFERSAKKERAYDVRKLEVIPAGRINGKMETTDFEYDETTKGGLFKASYDPKTKAEIYVDMKSGHVVYADILIKARDVDALPSLPLMRGFKGNGDATLEIKFYGDIVPMTAKK